MVKRKSKQILLKVYFDEMNSYEYLTDVLMQVLGYEITQAANCASIITERGEYVVKVFAEAELDIAKTMSELLDNYSVPARLIKSKK